MNFRILILFALLALFGTMTFASDCNNLRRPKLARGSYKRWSRKDRANDCSDKDSRHHDKSDDCSDNDHRHH